MTPTQRPGFDFKDQLIALTRLGVQVVAAIALLALGGGLLLAVRWAVSDLTGGQYVERLVGFVALTSIGLVAVVVIVSQSYVFISDTVTDLRLRHKHNARLLRREDNEHE